MISPKQSNAINTTRVFMVLGVIMVHCNILSSLPTDHNTIVIDHIVKFFSEEFPRFCVPWFFFISAFIAGNKYVQLTRNLYFNLLKKRFQTILIPYILWNTLALLFWQIINLSLLSKYTSGGYHFTSIGQFFIDLYISPILVPLWFLRNLMVFILALPLLKRLLRLSPTLFIITSILLEYFTPLSGIFYYSLGLVFANHDDKLNLIFKNSYAMGAVYCIIALFSTLSGHNIFDIPLLGLFAVLLGLFAFWGICQNIKTQPFKNTSGMVFFMYAFHGIISPYALKGLALTCHFHGLGYIIYYIITFATVTITSYLAYAILKRIFPTGIRVLTGQRT